MTIRTKTIEYALAWNTGSVLTAATRYEFPTMSLYIPETSSRTFRSVFVEINYRDGQATAGSQTSALIGIKLQTASFSDTTVTTTLTNSGEHQSFVLLQDVTSYFNSNFTTNPTASCQVAVQFGGIATSNHSAKLYITYDYDDIHNTRIKTVRIPLQSAANRLNNTSVVEIGSNTQIPILDTFLPEVGKTYRNIWFELFSNEALGSITNAQLLLRLDSESFVTSSLLYNQLVSCIFTKVCWQRDDMTTNVGHRLYAQVTGSTVDRLVNMGGLLNVTYEYVSSSTSQSINSVVVPLIEDNGFAGTSGSTGFYPSRTVQEFRINEPGPISFKQSGLILFYNTTVGTQDFNPIRISVNNTGSLSLTPTIGAGARSGQYAITYTINTGSIVLNRGINTFETRVDVTDVTTGTVSDLSAVGYINYTSGIATGSDSVHNQTRMFLIGSQTALNALQRYDYTFAPVAQTGSYFRTNTLGFATLLNYGATDGTISLTAQPYGSELFFTENKWIPLYESVVDDDLERGVITSFTRDRIGFKRYVNDPDVKRMDLSLSRTYRIDIPGVSVTANSANTQVGGLYCFWTYHNIYTEVTRSISGFPIGNGGSIPVRIYASGSDQLLYTTTSVSGAKYSFVAYDPNRTLYAVAYDTGSGATGRSKYFTPVV